MSFLGLFYYVLSLNIPCFIWCYFSNLGKTKRINSPFNARIYIIFRAGFSRFLSHFLDLINSFKWFFENLKIFRALKKFFRKNFAKKCSGKKVIKSDLLSANVPNFWKVVAVLQCSFSIFSIIYKNIFCIFILKFLYFCIIL